jgi:hypothetical protein
MSTHGKVRTTIELNPGDKERLQDIALSLGIVQTTGLDRDRAGSVSRLMQAIAKGDVITNPSPVTSTPPIAPAASTP